ncbi:uncharacterized protein LAESUDRAFT_314114 [Laetiporus sulphureus 93-53]|uniref:Uncharacterized protein n=1 Tax=Laetiporus sulphureus 93-53 TaxID=1314785 RepID=A0A165D621_9APHY|nr:uncharacterized protein LAESUDRAFT_314114 [Laetiporus sulphureus 93-53]KZT04217.1 hypothetical protein LAESUDRAFT_314114 [Laetiporus sulphureus 93-53]
MQANDDSGRPAEKTTDSTHDQQSCCDGEIESFSPWSLYSSVNYSDEIPAVPVQHELRVVNPTGSSDSDASSPTLCRAELASNTAEEDTEEYHLLSTVSKETRSTWMKLMIADIRQRLERLENILCTYNAVVDPGCRSPRSTISHTSETLASSITRPSSSIRDDYGDDAEELAACLEALKDMKKRVDHSREQSKRALEERKKEREAILSRCL